MAWFLCFLIGLSLGEVFWHYASFSFRRPE